MYSLGRTNHHFRNKHNLLLHPLHPQIDNWPISPRSLRSLPKRLHPEYQQPRSTSLSSSNPLSATTSRYRRSHTDRSFRPYKKRQVLLHNLLHSLRDFLLLRPRYHLINEPSTLRTRPPTHALDPYHSLISIPSVRASVPGSHRVDRHTIHKTRTTVMRPVKDGSSAHSSLPHNFRALMLRQRSHGPHMLRISMEDHLKIILLRMAALVFRNHMHPRLSHQCSRTSHQTAMARAQQQTSPRIERACPPPNPSIPPIRPTARVSIKRNRPDMISRATTHFTGIRDARLQTQRSN